MRSILVKRNLGGEEGGGFCELLKQLEGASITISVDLRWWNLDTAEV